MRFTLRLRQGRAPWSARSTEVWQRRRGVWASRRCCSTYDGQGCRLARIASRSSSAFRQKDRRADDRDAVERMHGKQSLLPVMMALVFPAMATSRNLSPLASPHAGLLRRMAPMRVTPESRGMNSLRYLRGSGKSRIWVCRVLRPAPAGWLRRPAARQAHGVCIRLREGGERRGCRVGAPDGSRILVARLQQESRRCGVFVILRLPWPLPAQHNPFNFSPER